jgi:hypothetical protein
MDVTSTTGSEGVRREIQRLADWAPLRAEADDWWQDEVINQFAADIDAVSGPLNSTERDVLLALLDRPDDDDIYGLLWSVLHLIETAPGYNSASCLVTADRPWFELLATRARNSDH